MTKTKTLLVLAIVGLLAVGLAVGLGAGALEGPDEGTRETAAESAQGQDLLDTGPATRLRDETASGEDREDREDRKQIARARSGSLRPVRLRFRCETLQHNVAGVWHHLQLRVRVEDESGQHLADCAKPWLPWTCSIPVDVDHIVLLAEGYKRKVIAAPPTFREGVRPTVVSLEPDALARVRAIHLPWTPGNRFDVTVRLATGVDQQGRPLLYAQARRRGRGSEPLRGQITADVKVPSGVAAMFVVRRVHRAQAEPDGFNDLESEVVTLSSGEEREITVDLLAFGVLEGRLTGLAQPALDGQVLSMKLVTEERGNFAPGGLAPLLYGGGRGTPVQLDADGHFRVTGLSKAPFTLQLRTDGGPWPALKEVGGDRRQWRVDETGFLVLEPATPVHGVVPVKGGRFLEQPFQVQANSPPGTHRLARRIPLFPRALLEKAPLFFFVEGIGHFNRSLAGRLPDPDGLYRVEVPVPGGSLLVHVADHPSRGLHLFARPVALAKDSPWVSITGKRTGSDWRFLGLAPGDYRLVMNYIAGRGKANRGVHSGRTMPGTVAIRSGQQTEVTIQMPELLEIRGEVANWQEVPASLAPRWLQLRHAGRPHTARIDRGTFRLTVMGPWEGTSEITFFSRGVLANLTTTDITWLAAEKRLLVLFPGGIRERWVRVAPAAGGRLWMHTYVADSKPLRRSPGRHGRHIAPQKDNRFLIAEAPGGVDAVVLEQVRKDTGNLRLLRGWFRLRPGGPEELHLSPQGRFVRVSMAAAEAHATLTLKPPAWWRHPPYRWASLRLAGDSPQQLWIPEGATAVVVDGQREIPVSSIGRELVIE